MLTHPIAAAGFYCALLMLGNVYLQYTIIKQRRSKRIGVGHGNDRDLERAMRVHANFVENATFGIGALILLALGGTATWPVHLVGAVFVAGRIAHYIGFSTAPGASLGRVGGMVLTINSLILATLILLYRAIM